MESRIQINRLERARILIAARRLFQRQGFEATTWKDLSDTLHAPEHELLCHFQSLDDLLEAVWSE
ncbi:MAG: TetR/AcrR family transcriptional regulator [Desulforhopalus sp.]|nr:TetR/AcrR family transcriptional regulator [Desulforhopalus sp.]